MWWWLTQRTKLKFVDGVAVPALELETIGAPELENVTEGPELIDGTATAPELEVVPGVTVGGEPEVEGGKIGC